MQMTAQQRTRAFQVVAEFLAQLRHVKGPAGRVELRAFHWREEEGGSGPTRDIMARKKVIAADTIGGGSRAKGKFDGELEIGERVELVGKVPAALADRWVHLFNFGTSGKVWKLAPSAEYAENRVRAGGEFVVPSAKLCPLGDNWKEGGPATSEFGQLERMLVLATREDVGLQLEDLHRELPAFGRDLYSRSATRGPERGAKGTRGAGFGAEEAEEAAAPRAALFEMDAGGFEYGLLELKVMAQGQ